MTLKNTCRHGVGPGDSCFGCEMDEDDDRGDYEYHKQKDEEVDHVEEKND